MNLQRGIGTSSGLRATQSTGKSVFPRNVGGTLQGHILRPIVREPLTITCGMKKKDFYIRHENGRINKTAGKRMMVEISKLARRLVELPEYRLPAVLPLLDAQMVRSIEICRKMDTRNHGRNREENYLAKQLLHMDPDDRQRVMDAVDPSRAPSTSRRASRRAKFAAENLAAVAQAQAEEAAAAAAAAATVGRDDEDATLPEEEEEEADGPFPSASSGEEEDEREVGGHLAPEDVPTLNSDGASAAPASMAIKAWMPEGAAFLQAMDAGPEIDKVAVIWKERLMAGDKETQREILGLDNLVDLTDGLDRQMFRALVQNAKKEDAEFKVWRQQLAEEAAVWCRSAEADKDFEPPQVLEGYEDLVASAKAGQATQAEMSALAKTKYQRQLLERLKGIAAQAILEAYQGMGAVPTHSGRS